MKHRAATILAAALGMLVLILDSEAALQSASEGIVLCLQTLIPSLFPYFVFSILLTGALAGQAFPFLGPLERLCRIPAGSGSLLLIGFLGGYPTGAQNVSLAYRSGTLSETDARRMIAFCNNAGPAFLFGMIGQFFDDPAVPWLLWGIHILSALVTAAILPGGSAFSQKARQSEPPTLSWAMERSVRVMGTVCGWVVFFRMVIGFLERWMLWLLPVEIQVLCKGMLELSNGCIGLPEIQNTGLRFVMASVLLSLGGLCVAMQTRSVSGKLSLNLYFPGKLLQCCVSLLLSLGVQFCFSPDVRYTVPLPLFLGGVAGTGLFTFLLHNRKNRGSFPAAIGV